MSGTTIGSRGLRAVARVRGVREQQSQLVLQRALAAQRDQETALDTLHRQLCDAGDLDLRQRMVLVNLSTVITETRDGLGAARHATGLARAQWESDKTRLTAVERLLERRAAEHRAEVARGQAREADDLTAAGWIRAQRSDAASEGHS